MIKSYKLTQSPFRCVLSFGCIMLILIGLSDVYANLRYSYEVSGSVTDQLGTPLSNAAVLSLWNSYEIDDKKYVLHVSETQTDEHGNYIVSGWGPKWAGKSFLRVLDMDPVIYVAKNGYYPGQIWNNDEYHGAVERGPNVTPEKLSKNIQLTAIRAAQLSDTARRPSDIEPGVYILAGSALCFPAIAPLFYEQMREIEIQIQAVNRHFGNDVCVAN